MFLDSTRPAGRVRDGAGFGPEQPPCPAAQEAGDQRWAEVSPADDQEKQKDGVRVSSIHLGSLDKLQGQAAHLSAVRQAMRLLGFAVTERPAPAIITDGDRSYYCPTRRVVAISPRAGESTLWHELCHSQQPGATPEYLPAYKRGGEILYREWMEDPLEIEARAVEVMVPLLDHPRLSMAIEAIGAIPHSVSKRAEWLKWVCDADLSAPKPERVARRARLTINALVRNRGNVY